ncbi:helicase-associated domain-containing protein [Streptomyces zingiberis]|uniref:helicase-associated domain-containing protein n=1 Tax=Streptomyces zingiberis TaxID=2053010 RepID=UPI001F101B7D|nr:helicase-associated domain-containing protein [Streptomyces zingiberis]
MTTERNGEAEVSGRSRPSAAPDGPDGPGPGGHGPGARTGTAPRTLAEELRARGGGPGGPGSPAGHGDHGTGGDGLAALLRARPDLLSPVPGDLTQLATRAVARPSVIRALERLDRFALQTAEALAVAPDPCPYGTLLSLMTGDGEPEERAVPGIPDAAVPAPSDASDAGAPGHGGPGGHTGHTGHTGHAGHAGDAVSPAPAPEEHAADAGAARKTAEAVAAELPRAVATLRTRALLWGGDDRLHLVRTVRELLAPATAAPAAPGPVAPSTGLGPGVADATAGMSPGRLQRIVATAGLPSTPDPVTAVESLTGLFNDRARMAALLAGAPQESLRVLDRLVWGPPYGTVPADPGRAVRWLTDRGLLLPAAPGAVVLPREVALHLRGGRAHRVVEPLPPPVETAGRHSPRTVDATAAGQAYTALGVVEDLLREWETAAPSVLRAGGLGVRDLKRTAAALDTDEATAAFWIELAHAAGLLASDGAADERFAPTPEYDVWREQPPQERWSVLAAAWLAATRTPGVAGGTDARGRALTVLGPGLDRAQAPEVRHATLALLATLPPGAAPRPETLLARLRWERGVPAGADAPERHAAGAGAGYPPGAGARQRRARGLSAAEVLRTRLTEWTLREAELLGVTGRGALTGHGRALLGAAPGPAVPGGPPADGRPAPDPGTTADTGPRPATPAGAGADPDPGSTWGPGTTADLGASTGTGTSTSTGAPAGTGPDTGRPAGTGAPAGTTTDPAAPGDAGTTTATDTGPAPAADTGTPAATGTGPDTGAPAATGADPGAGAPAGTGTGDATGAGATGGAVPATPAGRAAAAAALLAPLLPEPLDHVLLQADLTAVAPGPLRRPLAETLDVLAEVESKGGATVYRFTPESVRRALDSGRTPAGLHAFLAEHSRTPVPQPLTYLIDDMARRHGRLRVGAASAYVRCEDEATLAEILADRRAEPLRLRRLAPAVLASSLEPALLLAKLRELGYAPAAESAEGDVVLARPEPRRTPPRTPPAPVREGPPEPEPALVDAAVRAVRAGDRAASGEPAPPGAGDHPPEPGGVPRGSVGDTLAALQAAALTGDPVWIGCVGAEGAADRRLIAPVRVAGGQVTAYDHTAEEVRVYPLHRITGVADATG